MGKFINALPKVRPGMASANGFAKPIARHFGVVRLVPPIDPSAAPIQCQWVIAAPAARAETLTAFGRAASSTPNTSPRRGQLR